MEPTGVNLRAELAEKVMGWGTKPKSDEWHSRFSGEASGYLIREPSTRTGAKPVWKPDESVDQCLMCLDALAEAGSPVDYLIDNYGIALWRRRVDPSNGPVVEAPYNRDEKSGALPEALGRAVLKLHGIGFADAKPLPIEKRISRTEQRDPTKRQRLNKERAEYLQKNYERRWQFKK